MKSLVLVVAATTALLGACASVPTSDSTAVAANGSSADAYGAGVDGRTVNAINNVARTNGIEVHWINYPQAKPTPSNAVPAPDTTGT